VLELHVLFATDIPAAPAGGPPSASVVVRLRQGALSVDGAAARSTGRAAPSHSPAWGTCFHFSISRTAPTAELCFEVFHHPGGAGGAKELSIGAADLRVTLGPNGAGHERLQLNSGGCLVVSYRVNPASHRDPAAPAARPQPLSRSLVVGSPSAGRTVRSPPARSPRVRSPPAPAARGPSLSAGEEPLKAAERLALLRQLSAQIARMEERLNGLLGEQKAAHRLCGNIAAAMNVAPPPPLPFQ